LRAEHTAARQSRSDAANQAALSFPLHSNAQEAILSSFDARFPNMDSSTKDKLKGGLHESKGKIKEETGRATGNRDLQERGEAEKTGGKVKKKVGDVKKVFGK
jgi:uncharacterized protein YjbJ (UPF0337 family)